MDGDLARGRAVSIRNVRIEDLKQIAPHGFSVSVVEPLTDLAELQKVYSRTGLWQSDSGAVAIVDASQERLLGTCQFFRSGPCIHGLEIGYVIHEVSDRGRGYASEALALLSDYLFATREQVHRLQLTIEVTNLASCRVAEKCGYLAEGVLRNGGFPPDHADCFVYSRIREADV